MLKLLNNPQIVGSIMNTPKATRKSRRNVDPGQQMELFLKGDVPKRRRGDWEKFLKQVKSYFFSPLFWNFGMHAGVRERVLDIDYEVLRRVARRDPLFRAIVNLRKAQVEQYCQPQHQKIETGFQVYDENNQPIKSMIDFFVNTGFGDSPDVPRTDHFNNFVQKLVEETYTIDQVCIELRRDTKGRIFDFFLMDGSTIRRTTEFLGEHNPWPHKQFELENIQYVQIIDGQITAEYQDPDLIFSCMNPTAEISRAGYGYSYLEQAIDMVTSLLLGLEYNRKQFKYDNLPRGFIAVPGADEETITAIQEYWIEVMQGTGGKWRIPIVSTPSAADGGGSPGWVSMGNTNREMEYYKYMSLIMNMIAAIMGVDLAELGIRTENSTNIINNENVEARQKFSKSRGLTGLLKYIEGVCNTIVQKISKNWRFEFVGIPRENEQEELARIQSELSTYRSINDILRDRGLTPCELNVGQKESGQINIFEVPAFLNPAVSQAVNQFVQSAGGGMGGMGGFQMSIPQIEQESIQKSRTKIFDGKNFEILLEE